jgi:hypothetical protein
MIAESMQDAAVPWHVMPATTALHTNSPFEFWFSLNVPSSNSLMVLATQLFGRWQMLLNQILNIAWSGEGTRSPGIRQIFGSLYWGTIDDQLDNLNHFDEFLMQVGVFEGKEFLLELMPLVGLEQRDIAAFTPVTVGLESLDNEITARMKELLIVPVMGLQLKVTCQEVRC